jgi:hypothetical protein
MPGAAAGRLESVVLGRRPFSVDAGRDAPAPPRGEAAPRGRPASPVAGRTWDAADRGAWRESDDAGRDGTDRPVRSPPEPRGCHSPVVPRGFHVRSVEGRRPESRSPAERTVGLNPAPRGLRFGPPPAGRSSPRSARGRPAAGGRPSARASVRAPLGPSGDEEPDRKPRCGDRGPVGREAERGSGEFRSRLPPGREVSDLPPASRAAGVRYVELDAAGRRDRSWSPDRSLERGCAARASSRGARPLARTPELRPCGSRPATPSRGERGAPSRRPPPAALGAGSSARRPLPRPGDPLDAPGAVRGALFAVAPVPFARPPPPCRSPPRVVRGPTAF